MTESLSSVELPSTLRIRFFSTTRHDNESNEKEQLTPELLALLAGPTRTIDPATGLVVAPDGTETDNNPAKSLIFGVNLELVVDDFHILNALHRSLQNAQVGKMKTKTLPAELLYQLSSTGKINEAIKQFSVSETTTDLAVVFLALNEEVAAQYSSVYEDVCSRIPATEFPLSELEGRLLTAEKKSKISKVFKLTPREITSSRFSDAISMRLAMKDIEN